MANRLIHEQSPYLLQHAHNPVDWYPWGDEPFEKAQREAKPVLVSIGYSACHWCHVMEHESFENESVAAYMNQHFINIKVDREEHPDVDHLYMDAVQALNGNGGWPLNVFVTPERLPFFGGTYYPPRAAYNRPSWMQLLETMNKIWTDRQEDIKVQTDQMLQYLMQASQLGMAQQRTVFSKDTCRDMVASLLKQADKDYGGFGRAPKFPNTMAINLLLEYAHFFNDEEALNHALRSLDAMIGGGIYDQIGGGLARYATDAQWLIPHFEKMLYDNAMLISVLSAAYRITGRQRYKEVIEETISFTERELKDQTGLYYSALDADSEGEEGRFYTWTWDEWNKTVGSNPLAESYFGISEQGNWEGVNILHIARETSKLAEEFSMEEQEVAKHLNQVKQQLLTARAERIRPLPDDKSLLSWNALMNIALTKAGVALEDDRYINRAEAHMNLMLSLFQHEGALMHVWKNGHARIAANLDDYAFLIQAMIQLAAAADNHELLMKATSLMEIVNQEFIHEQGSFYYFTRSKQKDIPVRKVDLYDGVTPSGNAVMTHNLLLLGTCMERTDWLEQSSFMLQRMGTSAVRYPSSFAYWASLLQAAAIGFKTIVVAGKDALPEVKTLMHQYLPHCYFITCQKEISGIPVLKEKCFSDETLIFVCTQEACLAPVETVKRALQIISAY